MKEITIDWIEYVLLKKEKAKLDLELVEEDKYEKIREAVVRIKNTLYIQWDKKELWIYEDWTVELSSKSDWEESWSILHFEECTLWDLKENNVFFFPDMDCIYIMAKIGIDFSRCYYIFDDLIRYEGFWYSEKDSKAIKILRH